MQNPSLKMLRSNQIWFTLIYILMETQTCAYNQHDHNSRTLVLDDTTIHTLPGWFVNVVATKTEKLEYDSCKGLRDIVMGYDHGRLHGLKHLTVSANLLFDSYKNLKVLMNTTSRVQKGPMCENLEELHLIWLNCLKELCVGELPAGSLINLKSLKSLTIYGCKLLQSLFTSDVAQCLIQLENLFVEQCPLLERVIEASNKTVNSKKTVLPELTKLVMKELPMLYSGSSTVDIECLSLEHLYVKEYLLFSLSTSASDFQSRNQIQLHDQQHLQFLLSRVGDLTEAANLLHTIEALLDHDFENSVPKGLISPF